MTVDPYLQAAIEEAEAGMREGGIPIGSVLVHRGRILGRGHNRRVQRGSAILHGEMDALENAGRQPAPHSHPASVEYVRECPAAFDEIGLLFHRQIDIRIVSIQGGREVGNNADDCYRLLVQANHSANHRGIATESLLPKHLA